MVQEKVVFSSSITHCYFKWIVREISHNHINITYFQQVGFKLDDLNSVLTGYYLITPPPLKVLLTSNAKRRDSNEFTRFKWIKII